MKWHLIWPDASGHHDPPQWDILKRLPDRTENAGEADVMVVPVSRGHQFVFNNALTYYGKKPWVLHDTTEIGWSWKMNKSHIWGKNTFDDWREEAPDFPDFSSNPNWKLLDDWIRENPPILTFKRELLKKDVTEKLIPCEYLVFDPPHQIQSKDQFLNRPLAVLSDWGRSNEIRPHLHAEFFAKSGSHGYEIVSEWNHLDHHLHHLRKPIFASIYSPCWNRVDVSKSMEWYAKSQIAVAAPGAGRKTFRQREIYSCIQAHYEDDVAYSFPWTEENSIRLREGSEIKSLRDATMQPDRLYDTYVKAIEHIDRYRPERYWNEYMKPAIEKAL